MVTGGNYETYVIRWFHVSLRFDSFYPAYLGAEEVYTVHRLLDCWTLYVN